MAIKVLALASGVTGLADHRVLNGAMMTSAGQLSVRGGVLPGATSGDLSTVSAMVARVAPVKVMIPNGVSSALGPYLLVSDANVDVTFDAGEASVPRVDRIIARAYDNTNDGSGSTTGSIYYLKGQASGTATALPTNSILLYEMTVPAGASSGGGGINFANAVDQRVYTVAQGGVFPVASNTEMSAILNPYEGMTVYRTDLDVLYVYDGTNFKARGVPSVAASANLTSINNPYDGLLASARSTDEIYMYNGTTWVLVSAPLATRMGTTTLTANTSAAWTTTESAALMSVTFTAVSGHRYKISFDGSVRGSVAGDNHNINIRENNSSGTQLQVRQVNINSTSSVGFAVSTFAEWTASSSGSKTIVVTGVRNGGSGTGDLAAAATRPCYLTVDRIIS